MSIKMDINLINPILVVGLVVLINAVLFLSLFLFMIKLELWKILVLRMPMNLV